MRGTGDAVGPCGSSGGVGSGSSGVGSAVGIGDGRGVLRTRRGVAAFAVGLVAITRLTAPAPVGRELTLVAEADR